MSSSELGYGATDGNMSGSWDALADIEQVTVVQGCGCAACQSAREANGVKGSPNEANPENTNIGVLLPLFTNPDGTRSITGDRNVDATLIGSKWGVQNLTYSFPTLGSNYNGRGYDANGVSLYHLDLGTLQQAAAREGFAQIAAVTNMTFTEITETDSVHANIRVSQTGDNDAPSAYGGFPSDTRGVAGDIWFGRTSQPYYDLAIKGTWGFSTMLHEIGHTMGLKHGHQSYTNSDLSSFFGTSPRFGTQSLTPDKDGQSWSLMTYTPAPFTNGNFAGEKINQPQTFMQYDVAALQYMYGANYTTNATDSVYTFSQTTGEMFINGVGQGTPSGNKILLTIWDGGGNDTIDASNYAGGVTVDLRPGEFSTVDQAQLANHLAYQNLVALAPGNFAMSLLFNNDTRSLIENAKGGAGNDVFVGNTANNILDGGAGSDTVVFTNTTGVNVTLNDTGADVLVTHDGETDTLRSIENIQGTSGNDSLTGNSQNNTLTGGSTGADTLNGGAGDDRLIGGGFNATVTNSAPSQADITKPQATNNGSIATAVATAGAYDVDANPNITNATNVPHATINATATGGTLEYYRVDVTVAGSQAVFDIDGTGTLNDSIIELVNSAGAVLANNDTGPGDPGSTTGDDGYITYTFATAGTYYIRVGQYSAVTGAVAQPLTAGQTYQLHISLQNAAAVTTTVSANNTSSIVADGGEGSDFLQGTVGNDVLAGGNGTDTASFVTAFNGGTTTGVTVDLGQQGVAQNTVAAGTDTLTGIENLIGSALNDNLTGDAGSNVIEGGLGNDTLAGSFGSDTASYAGATAGVSVNLGLQGTAQNTGAAGVDTLSGFENLTGSAFNDTLIGNAGENIVSGGAGDDTLNPGTNTNGAADLLDGGAGSDTAVFGGYASGVTATLNGAANGTASVGGVAIASMINIENLQGTDFNDVLTGDAGANVIGGGQGDDVLDGGAGVDTVTFAGLGTFGVTVDLSNLAAQNTGAGNDTIVNFENVRTGSGADSITGDASDNVFFDGGGADTYRGGAGSDTVDYSASTSAVNVNLNTVVAQIVGAFGGSDTILDMENVVGAASFGNTLTGGNTTANRLVGGTFADVLTGGGQGDTIIGGAGRDVIIGDYNNTFNTAAETADGADVLEGGNDIDTIVGGMGNDTLRGGDGDDVLVGGIANVIGTVLSVVYVNDGGDDTFDGGEGADIAYAYYTDHTGAIAFNLANLAGNSAITVDGVTRGEFISVERVIFRGGLGNDVVRGGGTLDTLVGNQGDDILDGWFGNDALSGGLGNDTLIGGEGLDTATYVNSTAGVNVDLRIQGVAQDTGGEGVDTLIDIEYVTGSSFGDTLRGNDDFNLIIDNAVAPTATALSQTDSLFGYGGNDSMFVTRAFSAPATTIAMDGGAGDDFIELRGGTLSAALAANGAGLSGNTYLALGATSNDRNLDVVSVDGGAGNDRIILTGVASATINAGDGADTVSISMRGATSVNNHVITLGAGSDTIQLGVGASAATSTDVATTARTNRVTDFQAGNGGDRFELTNFLNFGLTGYVIPNMPAANPFTSGHLRLVQSGTDLLLQVDRDGSAGTVNSFVTIFAITNGFTGGFTAFNFDGFIGGDLALTGFAGDEVLTGAAGNDSLSGEEGNDVLNGNAGNDTLNGGNGDDVLRGGAGNDLLLGGSGTDTASFSDATAGVTVTLGIAGAQTTGAGNDTLTDIENLTGSSFGDTLSGDAGANVVDGGAGNDAVGGADGDDVVGGNAGDDFVYGDAGNDSLYGDAGGDVVDGGIGGDVVDGGADNDIVGGNEGDDIVGGNAGDDFVYGDAGNDTLYGDAGADVVDGGTGADLIDGGAGDDVVGGNEGDDIVGGNAGNDFVYGDAGNDTLFGNDGNDVVDGGIGADVIDGGAGDDVVGGNTGDDIVGGNAGNDLVYGDAGDDVLFGNDGNDRLFGGTGSDTLIGGAGVDRLEGGTGADVFRFTAADSTGLGFDTLLDVNAGEGDRIDLASTVTRIDDRASGTLSAATFDLDLSAALGGLGGGEAALFDATSGDFAGQTFLIADGNGVAGYQAGEDYVFLVATPVADLTPALFI